MNKGTGERRVAPLAPPFFFILPKIQQNRVSIHGAAFSRGVAVLTMARMAALSGPGRETQEATTLCKSESSTVEFVCAYLCAEARLGPSLLEILQVRVLPLEP